MDAAALEDTQQRCHRSGGHCPGASRPLTSSCADGRCAPEQCWQAHAPRERWAAPGMPAGCGRTSSPWALQQRSCRCPWGWSRPGSGGPAGCCGGWPQAHSRQMPCPPAWRGCEVSSPPQSFLHRCRRKSNTATAENRALSCCPHGLQPGCSCTPLVHTVQDASGRQALSETVEVAEAG